MPTGLQVIAIPCNQFGAQEPGSADEIKAFVYGETENARGLQLGRGLKGKDNFLLLEKSNVNGDDSHPIFALAKDKFPGGTTSKREGGAREICEGGEGANPVGHRVPRNRHDVELRGYAALRR
jgi:hypothetical protein